MELIAETAAHIPTKHHELDPADVMKKKLKEKRKCVSSEANSNCSPKSIPAVWQLIRLARISEGRAACATVFLVLENIQEAVMQFH